MLTKLADVVHGRPRRVLVIAFLLALVAGALGGSVADRLDPYGADDPATESVQARERIEEATGLDPAAGVIALVAADGSVQSRATTERVDRVVRELRSEPAIGAIASFERTGDPALVARDGGSTYVVA